MTAFPSNSSNVSTANLDSGSDKPADAREDLRLALVELSTIIDSFGDASGICPLDSNGKVDSSRLTGVVDTTELVDSAVETAKINDLAVTNAKIANTTIEAGKIANLATTISGSSTDSQIPTAKAVADHVATESPTPSLQFYKLSGGSVSLTQTRSNSVGTDTYTYLMSGFTSATAGFDNTKICNLLISASCQAKDHDGDTGVASVGFHSKISTTTEVSIDLVNASFVCQDIKQNRGVVNVPVSSNVTSVELSNTIGAGTNKTATFTIIGATTFSV
tara:strand:- start:1297 stop:2124 length:828 start_codon:yes stop_codon:yes gene_type:complete